MGLPLRSIWKLLWCKMWWPRQLCVPLELHVTPLRSKLHWLPVWFQDWCWLWPLKCYIGARLCQGLLLLSYIYFPLYPMRPSRRGSSRTQEESLFYLAHGLWNFNPPKGDWPQLHWSSFLKALKTWFCHWAWGSHGIWSLQNGHPVCRFWNALSCVFVLLYFNCFNCILMVLFLMVLFFCYINCVCHSAPYVKWVAT